MPVGELYSDQDNPKSVMGAPSPTASTDVPPPVAKPAAPQVVVVKSRMADENPDGTVRDTSTEALRAGNDLNFRNLSDEGLRKPDAPAADVPAQEQKPADAAPAPDRAPAQEAVPEKGTNVPEKLYAGKYKTVEEMEKAYAEAQRKITEQGQRNAELTAKVNAAPPPAPPVKTPEQLAAEQAENSRILNEFVSDPRGYLEQNVVQRVQTALTAQQLRNEWVKSNPDIAEHEIRVAFEATLLAQSDPELAKSPAALLDRATTQFRQFTGKLRAEGAKEALTTETRVIPLVTNTAPSVATENPSSMKAPLKTPDQYNDDWVAFLKSQEQKSHRGLRR